MEDPKPNFDIPKEREIFQGDADDRKALLKHRKWLEEERKRLDALEKWKKEQQRKKSQFDVERTDQVTQIHQKRTSQRLKYANIAVEAIQVMESLRQKLDLVRKSEYDYSQDKEAMRYANRLESSQKRKEEARQKKLEALAAKEAMKPKLTEEEIAAMELRES